MNRLIKTAIFIAPPFFVFGQTTRPLPPADPSKLPKMHIESSILQTTFSLGDNTVSRPELKLHFEKNSAKAYYYFQKSGRQLLLSYINLGVGVGTILLARASKNNETKLILGSAGLVSIGASVYCSIAYPFSLQNARDTYNRQAGF